MFSTVSKHDVTPRTPAYRKGLWEGLKRIKEIFKPDRSADEWRALLLVFQQATRGLEEKVKSFEKDNTKLFIIKEQSKMWN